MSMEATTSDSGETATADEAAMEEILKGLVPVQPSDELFERLSNAFTLASEETLDAADTFDMTPVTVPEDKLKAWARMMDEAAREVTEEKLRDLKAVPPTEFKLMRWLMSVENTSPTQEESPRKKSLVRWAGNNIKVWAASAAATFIMILGILSYYDGDQPASNMVRSGDLNREIINVNEEGIVWNEEKGYQKILSLDFKDTAVLKDENGNRMTVSGTSTEKVTVPVEIY